MGLDHVEFFRSLPPAIDHRPYTRDGNRVLVDIGEGRRVEIELSAERVRAIALLRIPVTDVTLRLHGFDQPASDHFIERFDLAFRRGGG